MLRREIDARAWQVPGFALHVLRERRTRYCVCIPVINEGARILAQLGRMRSAGIMDEADVLLLDGGSTDGSIEPRALAELGLRALLVKLGPGGQGAQVRMGFAYALLEGYAGIVTVDGNGKDSVECVPEFLRCLEAGQDFVQGSRYLPGGRAIRTPLSRALAIHLLHVPATRLASGFHYTDTTNAFRGYSRALLTDPRVQPFRDVFESYEMLAYLSMRAPQLGFRTVEIPVTREYSGGGERQTKISHVRGNLRLLGILWKAFTGRYDPRAE
jgi:glycosyltransferase involved in cell wall biosynthesis